MFMYLYLLNENWNSHWVTHLALIGFMSRLFNSFRLELEVEPIFASMALYDAKERKKVRLAVKQFFAC